MMVDNVVRWLMLFFEDTVFGGLSYGGKRMMIVLITRSQTHLRDNFTFIESFAKVRINRACRQREHIRKSHAVRSLT